MASLWSSLSRAERADLSKDFNSLDTSLAETAETAILGARLDYMVLLQSMVLARASVLS